MNYYETWVDLLPGVHDLEFTDAVGRYLSKLKQMGRIEDFSIKRRKFGFGPEALGEFNITMSVKDLAQLDSAFMIVAERDGEIENLHAAVFSKVCNYKSALYRDFPDEVRKR